MALDVNKLVQDMLEKMKPILGDSWNNVQQYAKGEAEKIAATVAKIEGQKLLGKITDQQAKILFDMQANASKAVLAALVGVGEMVAAKALGAGLAAACGPINEALGFKLL